MSERLSSAQRARRRDAADLWRLGMIVAVPVTMIMVAAILALAFFLQREIDTRCKAERQNREAIRATILAGDPTLLKPGDYGYSYTQANPAEAQKRRQDLLQAQELGKEGKGPLANFPPIRC